MGDGEVLFETEGSRTGFGSTALMTLVVLGVVLSLTLGIVAFMSVKLAKMVGSPWIYVTTFVASIGLGWWLMRHDRARIILRRDGAGYRMTVKGPAVNLDTAVEGAPEHWVSFFKFPAKHGGGEAVRYSVKVKVDKRRTLGFKLMAGARGTEPHDWDVRDRDLPDGDDVFTCPGIRELVEKLGGPKVKA